MESSPQVSGIFTAVAGRVVAVAGRVAAVVGKVGTVAGRVAAVAGRITAYSGQSFVNANTSICAAAFCGTSLWLFRSENEVFRSFSSKIKMS